MAYTAVVNTAAGWTSGVQWTTTAGGSYVEWYTPSLNTTVLSGVVHIVFRAAESNTAANGTIRADLHRVENDGTSPVLFSSACANGELSTSEGVVVVELAGPDLPISKQRLRLRVYLEDFEGALASGYTATLYYAGGVRGASGDTYLQIPLAALAEDSGQLESSPTTAAVAIAAANLSAAADGDGSDPDLGAAGLAGSCGLANYNNQTLYAVGPKSGSTTVFAVAKRAVSSMSWSGVSADVTVDSNAWSDYFIKQVGDKIHVVWVRYATTQQYLKYAAFSCSTETWSTVETITTSIYTTTDAYMHYIPQLDVRSDGDVVVVYRGPNETVSGTSYGRVYYALREGGSWTSGYSVESGIQYNIGQVGVCMAGSDRAVIVYAQIDGPGGAEGVPQPYDGTGQYRVLYSNNTLSSPYYLWWGVGKYCNNSGYERRFYHFIGVPAFAGTHVMWPGTANDWGPTGTRLLRGYTLTNADIPVAGDLLRSWGAYDAGGFKSSDSFKSATKQGIVAWINGGRWYTLFNNVSGGALREPRAGWGYNGSNGDSSPLSLAPGVYERVTGYGITWNYDGQVFLGYTTETAKARTYKLAYIPPLLLAAAAAATATRTAVFTAPPVFKAAASAAAGAAAFLSLPAKFATSKAATAASLAYMTTGAVFTTSVTAACSTSSPLLRGEDYLLTEITATAALSGVRILCPIEKTVQTTGIAVYRSEHEVYSSAVLFGIHSRTAISTALIQRQGLNVTVAGTGNLVYTWQCDAIYATAVLAMSISLTATAEAVRLDQQQEVYASAACWGAGSLDITATAYFTRSNLYKTVAAHALLKDSTNTLAKAVWTSVALYKQYQTTVSVTAQTVYVNTATVGVDAVLVVNDYMRKVTTSAVLLYEASGVVVPAGEYMPLFYLRRGL